MKEKFVMAYSCGKDSTLALFKMINDGYDPKCLLVTTGNGDESWFHGIGEGYLKRVSDSLGIELLFHKCNIETYEEDFLKGLNIAKAKYGVTACGFGDIDIEEHRAWNEDMCAKGEINCILPLWNKDRVEITHNFIDLGFKAIIKKVNLDKLDESFLGKELNKDLIKEFEKLGIDICGENGEYHTAVVGGPIFKEKIDFTLGEIKINKNYGSILIK